MEKITAIVPCYNEEKNITKALESVKWADEIMVIDSFSTDRTVEIARNYTSFILQHEYENSAAQKNRAIPQASHSWIFLLDADEIATSALREEVMQIMKQGTTNDAFWIRRQNFFMGRKIRFSGWQTDKVIRLFRRDTCRYQRLLVHAEIETAGKIGRLKGKIEHHSYQQNLKTHLKKLDIYTTLGAYDRLDKTGSISLFHLGIKPLYRFIKHYVFLLGFLDGKVGFVLSVLASYTVFLRSVKLWRIQKGEHFEKRMN